MPEVNVVAPITGTVAPPADLTPAIEALGQRGREYLDGLKMAHGKVEPWMIAKAADYERGEHG